MVRDAMLILSDAQAETSQAAHDSDNVIDFGASGADYGAINEAHLFARVRTTCTSGGSATLTVKLQDSADNSSWADVEGVTSGSVAVADLESGLFLLRTKLPRDLRRYIKLVYTIGTAALTAGDFDAWVAPFGDPDV